MILIEHILGNAKKDPHWKHKLESAKVDLLSKVHEIGSLLRTLCNRSGR